MKKIVPVSIFVFVFCAAVFRGNVFAAEGGTGHYIPGALADFMDIGPAPGFALLDWYNHYSGSAGANKPIEFGGVIAANISADSNIEMVGGIYTFPCHIFGGNFSTGMLIPYMWIDVTGTITGPRGRTFTRTDTADGLSDIIMPFWLSWNCGDFKWSAMFNVYAPTGQYDRGQLANVGLNYWTFEPMAAFSYVSKKIGLEVSATGGFDFNTINGATDYQSGDIFHLDATVAEHLGVIGVGVNAFYWKQFTADSGSGAKLGSFETLMTGVGPVFSYISPKFCGNHTVVAEVKYLPQIDTSKTLSGNFIWFKAALTF